MKKKFSFKYNFAQNRFLKALILFPAILFQAILFSGNAHAELSLTLTQGVSSALPVAVIPFAGQPTKKNNLAPAFSISKSANNVAERSNFEITNIAAVVRNDLSSSGEFSVPALSSWNNLPNSKKSQVGFWRSKGIDDVLFGEMSASSDKWKINIKLQAMAANSTSPKKLISERFKVTENDFRSLAHYISDQVYTKLTGVRGIFSTRIAYVLTARGADGQPNYKLQIADEDGANARTIFSSRWPIMSPSWSPNGLSIAYVSFDGNRAKIILQTLASGERRVLTSAPGINGAPAFSPDGKTIAVVLTVTRNPKIYLLNLSTGKRAALSRGFSIDTEPQFSPDGKQIVFTSNRGGSPQIYSINLNQSGGSRTNDNAKRLTFKGNYNAHAEFLPDGKALVLMHRDQSKFSIAKLNLADGQLQVLSQQFGDESPSVAPNGRMVIYATRCGRRVCLAEVSIDGQVRSRLPALNGSAQEPAWSPFLT